MNIKKAAQAAPSGAPNPAQLERINALGRGHLTAEDVYVFSVILCDDRPDRDDERFDTAALAPLAELFRGKTGVMDHDWSAQKQVARIFDTELIADGAATAIKAWCYALRSEQALVAEIEAGIKKEVSVGCAMGKKVCSVCGAEYGQCAHKKGESYAGETCYAVLCEPKDAYEFSFVAVPAQPAAGVQKLYGDTEKLARLEAEAELGRAYLASLRRDVTALALSLEVEMKEASLQTIAGKLTCEELQELKAALQKKVNWKPQRSQLFPREQEGGIGPEFVI